MNNSKPKLGAFLSEVVNWRWDEFCAAELSDEYTSLQAVVFSLIRICSDGKLNAIRHAIDRVDGKIPNTLKFEFPKIYLLYPYATSVEGLPEGDHVSDETGVSVDVTEESRVKVEEHLGTLTLRQTVDKMIDSPRGVVPVILDAKVKVETVIRQGGTVSDAPLVKSIIAANLLSLAGGANYEAISEVFDQIDGKLVETIKLLGDDVFLTQYSEIAPAGAVKNEDGIYMIENRGATQQWAEKLQK